MFDTVERMASAIQRVEVTLRQQHVENMMFHVLNGAAIWKSDSSGACTYASPALIEIVGGDPRGSNWLSYVHPDDRREALHGSRRYRLSLPPGGGGYRPWRWSRSARRCRDCAGSPATSRNRIAPRSGSAGSRTSTS